MYQYSYTAPCTILCLNFNEQYQLIGVHWQNQTTTALKPLSGSWAQQLDAYFAGKPYAFNMAFIAQGTPFQERVWQAISEIPHGQVASYGNIAHRIGSHPRAVGQACGKNPLPIIIPCHRVVATHGLGGFSLGKHPEDLTIKRWLLAHEGAQW